MGNLHCSSISAKKNISSNFPETLTHQQKKNNISNISSRSPEKKPTNIVIQMPQTKSLISLTEIKDALKFQNDYFNLHQYFEINKTITHPMNFKSPIFVENTMKKQQSIPRKSNYFVQNSEITEKSFRELFQNDENYVIPYSKPSILPESNRKSSNKETKNSTPHFEKNKEINELLPYLYLPKQPSFSNHYSEEKPRKFDIEQIKLESLHISEEQDIYDKTVKEFSINDSEGNLAESSASESEEPQCIHINLFDLLQNEMKTRKNSLSVKDCSLSVKDSPIKSQPKQLKTNDSQSSFKTLKKSDYLPPLKKNRPVLKESLNLSKKK